MELRQDLRWFPTRPIVLAMAILAVLALGLTAWYSLVSTPAPHPGIVTASGFPGPDARDRNQQIQLAHENNPEKPDSDVINGTHGH